MTDDLCFRYEVPLFYTNLLLLRLRNERIFKIFPFLNVLHLRKKTFDPHENGRAKGLVRN